MTGNLSGSAYHRNRRRCHKTFFRFGCFCLANLRPSGRPCRSQPAVDALLAPGHYRRSCNCRSVPNNNEHGAGKRRLERKIVFSLLSLKLSKCNSALAFSAAVCSPSGCGSMASPLCLRFPAPGAPSLDYIRVGALVLCDTLGLPSLLTFRIRNDANPEKRASAEHFQPPTHSGNEPALAFPPGTSLLFPRIVLPHCHSVPGAAVGLYRISVCKDSGKSTFSLSGRPSPAFTA